MIKLDKNKERVVVLQVDTLDKIINDDGDHVQCPHKKTFMRTNSFSTSMVSWNIIYIKESLSFYKTSPTER